jgi:hypothetical protein
MTNWTNFWWVVALFLAYSTKAQEDLLAFLEEQEEPYTAQTIATFKNTRLINGHSVETNAQGVLQFLIGHRFGRINSGSRNLFGLDNALIRLGFEYGVTDRLNLGLGRSSFQKMYDGTLKYKIAKQQYGASSFPVTATWVSNMYASDAAWSQPERENLFSSRLAYHHSLLVARKFNEHLSFQLSPTVVHRNLVKAIEDNNTIFSLGMGTSVRLNGSLRANVEYFYIFPNQISSTVGGEKVRNCLAVGLDLETGGHVFQLHLTNSRGMTEKILIGETTGDWLAGDIHFGFNVSRVFTVVKPKVFL